MHEYNMKDQKLADEVVIQDMYVLCKIFEKEGVGTKTGAQYGAPFNEEEWDDDADVGKLVVIREAPFLSPFTLAANIFDGENIREVN